MQVPTSSGQFKNGWQQSHEKMRKLNELGPEYYRWTSHHEMKGMAKLPRLRDCVNIACELWQKQEWQQLKHVSPAATLTDVQVHKCPLLLDVSQSADRKPFAVDKMRAMCSSSTFYYFPQDRCLLPKEHLFLAGWPSEAGAVSVEGLSPTQIRDLAGESMSLPCVTLALASLALALCAEGLWAEPLSL